MLLQRIGRIGRAHRKGVAEQAARGQEASTFSFGDEKQSELLTSSAQIPLQFVSVAFR